MTSVDLTVFSKLEHVPPAVYASFVSRTDMFRTVVRLRSGAYLPCYVGSAEVSDRSYAAALPASMFQVLEDDPDVLAFSIVEALPSCGLD